jgi:hypothetical protein
MVATENKAINPDLEQDMAKRAGSSTAEWAAVTRPSCCTRLRLRCLSNG